MVFNFLEILILGLAYFGQTKKNDSSLTALITHCLQSLSALGLFGEVYLPYSISNLWQLVLKRAKLLRSDYNSM